METRAIALGIGGRARARHYPDLLRAWAQRAARIRWNVVRAAQGRTLLPVPDVPDVQTPGAAKMRQRRAQARRRAAALGLAYHDRMASNPLMTRETTIETDARRPADLAQARVVNIGGWT